MLSEETYSLVFLLAFPLLNIEIKYSGYGNLDNCDLFFQKLHVLLHVRDLVVYFLQVILDERFRLFHCVLHHDVGAQEQSDFFILCYFSLRVQPVDNLVVEERGFTIRNLFHVVQRLQRLRQTGNGALQLLHLTL